MSLSTGRISTLYLCPRRYPHGKIVHTLIEANRKKGFPVQRTADEVLNELRGQWMPKKASPGGAS
jgi:hypothetical protein